MLARPISLDHVRVRTPGWQALSTAHACPETEDDATTSLAEGTQCTWWGQGDAVSSPFVVEGLLWNERVERVVRADLSRSLEVVRELSAMRVLDEELQKLAERAARAVNSVWSLYTSWGGDDGYSDGMGFGRGGFGMSCGGCGGGIGHGGGFGTMGPRGDLAAELERIVRTCKPEQVVDVDVETTLDEIVDVEVKAVSADLRTCVQEALWNAWLASPGAPKRTITRLSVKPA
jgi:hypothetical protein